MFASHPPYGNHLHSVTLLFAIAAPVLIWLLHRRGWKFSLKLALMAFPLIALACVWLRSDLWMLVHGHIGIDWKSIVPASVLSGVIVWGLTRPRLHEDSDDDTRVC
jgi:hypothetical protein